MKNRFSKGKKQGFLGFIFYLSLSGMVLGLSCCSKKPPKADVNAPAVDAVVTVNGFDITESNLKALIKPEIEKIKAKTANLPSEFIQQYEKQLTQWSLDKLISEHLLDEQVKQAKIVVTEEELLKRMGEIAAAQQPPLTLEEYQKKLEDYGQSFDAYKREFRRQMLYQKLLEPQWAGKLDVNEADAKQYYSDNLKEFDVPEQTRASHILIVPDTSQPDADPNQAKTMAKAKAEALLKQIREGADFAALAKANSACSSAANGGDLNFFARGQMVAPFDKAAFELQPGQISDVVETKFGYHIIKVTDRKEASKITFEEVKDRIIDKLKQQKQSDFVTEYIESLKDKAHIVYHIKKE